MTETLNANRVATKENRPLKVVGFAAICLLVGLYFGVQLERQNSVNATERRSVDRFASVSNGKLTQPISVTANEWTSKQSPTNELKSMAFAMRQGSRVREILLRELNSEVDAKSNIESDREQLWKKMSSLGMPFKEFEAAITNLIQIQKYSFLAEAAAIDLIQQRSEYNRILTNVMTASAINNYKQFDLSRNSLYYLDEVVKLASEKHIAMDAQMYNTIHDSMIKAGAYLENSGGPFDPAPNPLSGDDGIRYLNDRANHLEKASRDLLVELSGKVPDDIATLMSESLARQVARDRSPILTEAEMQKRHQELIEEIKAGMKPTP